MRKESASGVRTLLAGVRGMAWLKGKGGIPLEAQALYRRAREMADRGKYEEAVALLKQGVMIAPCFMRALDELGECLGRLGRYPEALAAYDHVLCIEPANRAAAGKRDRIAAMIRQQHRERASRAWEARQACMDGPLMATLADIASQQGMGILQKAAARNTGT